MVPTWIHYHKPPAPAHSRSLLIEFIQTHSQIWCFSDASPLFLLAVINITEVLLGCSSLINTNHTKLPPGRRSVHCSAFKRWNVPLIPREGCNINHVKSWTRLGPRLFTSIKNMLSFGVDQDLEKNVLLQNLVWCKIVLNNIKIKEIESKHTEKNCGNIVNNLLKNDSWRFSMVKLLV